MAPTPPWPEWVWDHHRQGLTLKSIERTVQRVARGEVHSGECKDRTSQGVGIGPSFLKNGGVYDHPVCPPHGVVIGPVNMVRVLALAFINCKIAL